MESDGNQPFGPPRAGGTEPWTVRATVHSVPSVPPPPPPLMPTPMTATPASWRPAQPAVGGPYGVLTDQRPIDGAVVAIAWVLAVLTLGYMLPWAIAATRGKANHGAIALINVFLGWSIIGWIVALVMACQAHQVAGVGAGPSVVIAQSFQGTTFGATSAAGASPPAGWYPEPGTGGRRYWDGARWTDHRAP